MNVSRILTAGLLAVLIACSSGPLDSGISGTVTYGPTCPVERVGASPCETPYATTITFTKGGKEVAFVTSGVDGTFRLALPPGTYTINTKSTGIGGSQPQEVVVRAHSYTEVQLMVDSGIR